jgi:hypothetical protein
MARKPGIEYRGAKIWGQALDFGIDEIEII